MITEPAAWSIAPTGFFAAWPNKFRAGIMVIPYRYFISSQHIWNQENIRMKRTLWKQENYKEYPVMVNQEQKQYCDKRILEKIEDQFNYAEQGKSKVFFMRYDARFPQDDCEHADNHSFRSFQANFMKNLSRKGLKPQYVAVREQSREKHQHYHVCLWLDGNKTQSIHNHIQTAERLWRS